MNYYDGKPTPYTWSAGDDTEPMVVSTDLEKAMWPVSSSPSEDVMDQPDTISLGDLEAEIEGSGVDPRTCVDTFVVLNGDTFFVTRP